MKTLTELALEYKKTKQPLILGELFTRLEPMIKEKAQYIFYKKVFKGNVVLAKTKLVELEDVEQELHLTVLRLLERYDTRKSFETYLYSTLWNIKLHNILNEDFYNQLKTVHSEISEEGEETSPLDNIAVLPKIEESIEIEHLFTKLSGTEKKIIEILKLNPSANISEIATILKVTKQAVHLHFKSLRRKYNQKKKTY